MALSKIARNLGEFDNIIFQDLEDCWIEKLSYFVDILFYNKEVAQDIEERNIIIEQVENILSQENLNLLCPYYFFLKAKFYWATGQYDEIEQCLCNALELEDDNPDIMRFFGLINYKLYNNNFEESFKMANDKVLKKISVSVDEAKPIFLEHSKNTFYYFVTKEKEIFCKLYDNSWWKIEKDNRYKIIINIDKLKSDFFFPSIKNRGHSHAGNLEYGNLDYMFSIFLDYTKRHWNCCNQYLKGDKTVCPKLN